MVCVAAHFETVECAIEYPCRDYSVLCLPIDELIHTAYHIGRLSSRATYVLCV